LRDVNLTVHVGEVLGIAGLMGAGRTELLECLYGSSRVPPQGTVLVNGKSVTFRHPAEALAAGVALVTEDRKRLGLFVDVKVGHNIAVCRWRGALGGGLITRRDERAMAKDIVERLHVKTPGIEARITNLSGGNQQKCIIGRGLLTRPKILLLDDPTRGVEVGAKAELYRLIDGLCREGLAVLVPSRELPRLFAVASPHVVCCAGR